MNGVRDDAEFPVEGVRVSNGREIALTDEAGEYELPVHGDTVLLVVNPAGIALPHDENH